MKNIISISLLMITFTGFLFTGCATKYGDHSSTDNSGAGNPGVAATTSSDLDTNHPQPDTATQDNNQVGKPEGPGNCDISGEIMDDYAIQPIPSMIYPSSNDLTPADVSEAQAILDQALELCQVSQEFWHNDEPENAIQALDQAYSLLLTAGPDNTPGLSQQKEDLRYLISKRILEIHASRHIVAKGTNTSIPIILNDHVKAEIKRFTHQERNFFIRSFQRSGKYRPAILKSLKEAGLPEELSWLPLIESGFKVRALSRARALGLWQFIPSTGYKFGLKRDRFVDDRMDPERAPRAAIAYLKELHQIFGDWATVLAAYNCGEGRVLRTIRSQNINYLDNFWDLYDRLPRETARYVPRFLATLHIMKNMKKYGFESLTPAPPLEFDVVTISKQIRLKDLANVSKIPYDILKNLNPELRYGIIPPGGYKLKVPVEKGAMVLANIKKIRISSPPQRASVYHRVRKGESLSSIANRYRTSVKAIARINHINRCNYIVAGKILKIPGKGNSGVNAKTSRHYASSHKKILKYKVKKGDSLWKIAKKYNTSTRKLRQLNHLSSTRLHIGQVLKIQSGKNASRVYLVKRGDSPFTIASKHNMELNRLLKLNHLTNKSKIYPGQKLFIE